MSPGDLLEALETIGDAPEGIGRLRDLVLQLAVRGKLIEQEADDAPVCPDLSRAAKLEDRSRWHARLCHDAPESWARCPMMCIGKWGSGGTPKKSHSEYYDGEIPWLMISDLNNGTVTDTEKKITKEGFESSSTKMVPPGTVFVGLYGSIGKCAIAGIECCTNQAIGHCIPDPKLITTEYLFRLIQALAPELFDRGQGGAQKNISQTIIKHLEISLPPLAEQERIVAKVDELMALLDELDKARDERDAHRAAFRDSALAALQNAEDSDAAHAAWSRITANLSDCITDPADIAPLRQTILQLAVRGRLVPQDPKDEPASELLKSIKEEKADLVRAKEIRKPKPTSLLECDELGFVPPEHWVSTRLTNVVLDLQTGPFGSMLHKSDYLVGGTPVINPASYVNGTIEPIESMAVDDDTLIRLTSYRMRSGDILVARRGELGRCAVITDNEAGWLCGTGSLMIRMSSHMDAGFLAILIGTPGSRKYLGGVGVGITMKSLNHSILMKMPIAIPPLEEQYRIVAKIDELMAICDELEQRLTEAKTHQSAFAAAAVHHLDLAQEPESV